MAMVYSKLGKPQKAEEAIGDLVITRTRCYNAMFEGLLVPLLNLANLQRAQSKDAESYETC